MAQSGLRWEVLRVETRYQWYRREGAWEFEPVKTTKRVADGRIDAGVDAPARIAIPVQWGRYRLEVASSERKSRHSCTPETPGIHRSATTALGGSASASFAASTPDASASTW